MTDFDVDKIYRQYADAYVRCNEIEQSLRILDVANADIAGELTVWELRRDGDDAYFELLALYHKLSMCMSLDIAAVRAKLRKYGVFAGDDENEKTDGKTIQTELDLEGGSNE